MKNWWHYYKWYLICGILLLLICADLAGKAFGWFTKSPDVQIAYVGESPLPDDTVTALEREFASLAEDYNNDGSILVRVNQFVSGSPEDSTADAASYRQAAMLKLMGDINDCESYFFLMEDADTVQKEFQVLAMPDGSCPANTDFSTEGKVFPWESCSLLTGLELGSYTTVLLGQETSGSSQELLANLSLGRRCFYDERHTDYADECSQLWDTLQGNVQSPD